MIQVGEMIRVPFRSRRRISNKNPETLFLLSRQHQPSFDLPPKKECVLCVVAEKGPNISMG